MDITSTIIGISLFLLFVIPIVLLNRRGKKTVQLFKKKLFSQAEKESCTINEFEIWNNAAIGIDTESSKIFFLKKVAYKDENEKIDLKEVSSCQLINTNQNFNTKDGQQTIVEKLELVFSFKEQQKDQKSFVLYDRDLDNINLNGEVQIAQKWLGILTKELELLHSKNLVYM